MAAEGHSPLAQFEIKQLIPLHMGQTDVSFTNSALFMTATVILITLFMVLGMRRHALVPGRWQSMAELAYEFVANLLRDTVGNEGRKYFPFVFTLFMFILFGNMLGMIPYSFTFTSHIIVTFALALVVFLGVTILGFVKHGIHFFSFFVPPGVSVVLWPLMIPIELISYLSRPISLAVRLFANLVAGHVMLTLLLTTAFVSITAFFQGDISAIKAAFGLAWWALALAIFMFEVIVILLQAYIFTLLSAVYIDTSINVQH